MSNPIAYLILCHTDPHHVHRLIDALDTDADFFVHVDAKTSIEPFSEIALRHNVFFATRRVAVYWGGFSVVEATLNLISDATDRSSYGRLVLLSGLDYPIKSAETIRQALLSNPDTEFIRFFDIEQAESEVYLDLASSYYFFDAPKLLVNRYYDARRGLQRFLKPIKKDLLASYRHCFGHQLWAITDRCARYVVGHARSHPELSRFYKYSFAPDERFIHTIVANSPFCRNAGGIEPYSGFGTYLMANLHHIHPSLTKVYTIDDFEELTASDKLFVKKVTSAESAELLRQIDTHLR